MRAVLRAAASAAAVRAVQGLGGFEDYRAYFEANNSAAIFQSAHAGSGKRGLLKTARQHIEQMSFNWPFVFSACHVVNDEPCIDLQTCFAAHRLNFSVGKYVAHRGAGFAIQMPLDGDITILFAPGQLIAQKAQSCRKRAVVACVITMAHIDKCFAVWSQQARELAQHFDSAGLR